MFEIGPTEHEGVNRLIVQDKLDRFVRWKMSRSEPFFDEGHRRLVAVLHAWTASCELSCELYSTISTSAHSSDCSAAATVFPGEPDRSSQTLSFHALKSFHSRRVVEHIEVVVGSMHEQQIEVIGL